MNRRPSARCAGLTMIEVLMIVAALLLLVAVFLPAFANRGRRSSRVGCTNMLKQLGLAYRIWSGDNSDRFPMQVSTNDGGSMEFIGQADQTFRHFLVMSNELNTPKLLVCPHDSKRAPAIQFPHPSGLTVVGFGNSNVSYFVGVDAEEIEPTRILSGDRNITNGTRIVNGILTLTTNTLAGWTDDIHRLSGNVGFADGSVLTFTSSALRDAVARTGIDTNRLAMP